MPYLRLTFYVLSTVILCSLATGLSQEGPAPITQFNQFAHYTLIGVLAALVANSTGAGGGIIFLPIFINLGLSPIESLATSLAIQCFGMNSGALAWLYHRHSILNKQANTQIKLDWQQFYPIVRAATISSWFGLLAAQYWLPSPDLNIELAFSVFSLCIGSIILYRTLRTPQEHTERSKTLLQNERLGLIISCFIGGGITAWLSVGIGEVLAIYLIFLGFRINFAVACAVCVTATSVVIAMPYHLTVTQAVNIDVLVYAAPGALLGGALAKKLAMILGPRRLKLMMSVWIIISALVYLS